MCVCVCVMCFYSADAENRRDNKHVYYTNALCVCVCVCFYSADVETMRDFRAVE